MPVPAESRQRVRFGEVKVDLQTREITRNGRTFSLQEKPFQVLALLLERPGQLVTRDELKERLWSSDTFVDFDQSLNKAVNRLREALGDQAGDSRLIETLAGRGYRFIAAVTVEPRQGPGSAKASDLQGRQTVSSASSTSETASPFVGIVAKNPGQEKQSALRKWFASRTRRMITLVVIFGLVSVGFMKLTHVPGDVPESPPRQLTSNSSENHISGGAISPDGRFLAYTDKTGMHIRVLVTGEVQDIAQPATAGAETSWEIVTWFPDGTRLIANSHPLYEDATDWSAQDSSVWIFSVLQAAPRKLRDDAEAFSVSPNGDWIAFGTKPARVLPVRGNLKMGGTRAFPGHFGDREIWQMAVDGQQAHKLYEAGEGSTIGGLHWSGEGNRTLYLKTIESGSVIETNDLSGGSPKEVLRFPVGTPLRDYLWLADGRLLYVLDGEATNSDNCNYWELPIDTATGELLRQARQLTNWTGACMGSASITLDGKHLAFLKWKANTSVYVADFQDNGKKITVPKRLTLDEGYNNPMAWTPDSRAVFFLSNRNGPWGIFKQAIDGSDVETMTVGNGLTGGARITPDGLWMLFRAHNLEKGQARFKVMRIPVSGGVPELVWAGDPEGLDCASVHGSFCVLAVRGEDHKQLIFTVFDPLQGSGRELARFDTSPNATYSWKLSPDGTHIAVYQPQDSGITIIPITGGIPYRVTFKSWNSDKPQMLPGVGWWTADGKALLASSPGKRGVTLLHIDLKGNATVLWEREGSPNTFAVPSPDGRHLAMMAWDVSSNLWMVDNFSNRAAAAR